MIWRQLLGHRTGHTQSRHRDRRQNSRWQPGQRPDIARAKPFASVFHTGGIQGAYRGYTGGKAPAWEVIATPKPGEGVLPWTLLGGALGCSSGAPRVLLVCSSSSGLVSTIHPCPRSLAGRGRARPYRCAARIRGRPKCAGLRYLPRRAGTDAPYLSGSAEMTSRPAISKLSGQTVPCLL